MYALIIFMQTISRLARIGGVPQTLLSRDIVHSISSVISVAHECLMVATPALTDAEIQQEYQSEDLGAEEMVGDGLARENDLLDEAIAELGMG